MREILSLIPRQYRRGCFTVALMVPVKAVLDLVGVAALLPVMMLVLSPEKLQASRLGTLSRMLDFSTEMQFAIFVIAGVVAILLLKMALSLVIVNYQNRFLLKLYRNLSSRLFISLYSRGLLYIKNQNSSRLTFNVIAVCYNFTTGYLGGLIRLAGEIAFVVLMLAALLIYSPKATLMSVCAFVPVAILYICLIRKPLREMSRKENEARREQHRLLTEAFKGYSDVQVNDAFANIQRRFSEGLNNISNYRVRSGIIQSIPSYLLELSVVVIVAIMMLFSFDGDGPANAMFLGVYAVALLKLLPAVKGIISSVSALNSTAYTKEVISEINTPGNFNLIKEDGLAPLTFEHAITVEHLSFTFPDDNEPLIKDLSFEIRKGDRFGIKGRTGSGKTTLFNILLGLYPAIEGKVLVDGVALTQETAASWHKLVGYVPQEVFVADTSLIENVALGFEAASIDRNKAVWALEQASLADLPANLPQGLDTRIGEAGCKLSGGQKQRLGIARALYKNSTVLFFDEATSSLDVQTEREVNEAIEKLSDARRDITIIVISHRDSTLSFCGRILEL